jgi:hypothetical protein
MLELLLIVTVILLLLVFDQTRSSARLLARIHDDLHIVCTVLQETPEEKAEREKEGWEYAGTPNLIRQKKSENNTPVYREG